MKALTTVTMGTLLALVSSAVFAGNLEEVLAKTAYRTQPALAAQADASYARAMEIIGSKFTAGTSTEYRTELNKAANLGHEDAAAFLCMFNSHEAMGTFFF